MSEDIVTLARSGRNFELQLNRSYSVQQISRMFQVEPSSIWLHETFTNKVYFPGMDNSFDLKADGVLPFTDLSVEGTYLGASRTGQQGTVTLSATGDTSSPSESPSNLQSSYPGFTPMV